MLLFHSHSASVTTISEVAISSIANMLNARLTEQPIAYQNNSLSTRRIRNWHVTCRFYSVDHRSLLSSDSAIDPITYSILIPS